MIKPGNVNRRLFYGHGLLMMVTDDLFKNPYPRIPHTEAALTVVGGKVVFVSPSFLPQEMRENLLGRESQK